MSDFERSKSLERGAGVGGRLDGSAGLRSASAKPVAIRTRRGRERAARSRLFADRACPASCALIEFTLILLIGIALYFGYVGPATRMPWVYCGAIADDRDLLPSSPSRRSNSTRSTPSAVRSTRWRSSCRPGRSFFCSARRSPSSESSATIFPRLVCELLRLRPVRAAGDRARALHHRAALDARKAGSRAAP